MDEDRAVDIIVVLAVLLIPILKICGIIKWSWLWILSPIWIGLLFGLLLAFVLTILMIIEGVYWK